MLANGSFESTPSQVIKQRFGFRGKLMPLWVTRLRQWWHKDCGEQPLSPPLLFGSFFKYGHNCFEPVARRILFNKMMKLQNHLLVNYLVHGSPSAKGKDLDGARTSIVAFWCMARQVNVIMWRPYLQFSSFGPLMFPRQQVVFVCDDLRIKVWSSEMESRQEKNEANVLKKDRSD